MDIIPFFKFVAAIILGGITFYFFLMFLNEMISETGYVPSAYFNAMMAIFTFIPAVILFRSGIKLIMHMQKKRV